MIIYLNKIQFLINVFIRHDKTLKKVIADFLLFFGFIDFLHGQGTVTFGWARRYFRLDRYFWGSVTFWGTVTFGWAVAFGGFFTFSGGGGGVTFGGTVTFRVQ